MNVDRIKLLADTIEKGVVEFPNIGHILAFNMSAEWCNFKTQDFKKTYFPPVRKDLSEDLSKVTACGCIAGFAVAMFAPELAGNNNYEIDYAVEASNLLGIEITTGNRLFYTRMGRHIPGSEAARVLRRFLMTGEIDWSDVA